MAMSFHTTLVLCGEHRQRGWNGKVALRQTGDLKHDLYTRDACGCKAGGRRMDLAGGDGTVVTAALRGNEDRRREGSRSEDIHDEVDTKKPNSDLLAIRLSLYILKK